VGEFEFGNYKAGRANATIGFKISDNFCVKDALQSTELRAQIMIAGSLTGLIQPGKCCPRAGTGS
jgi:hypothetical protein